MRLLHINFRFLARHFNPRTPLQSAMIRQNISDACEPFQSTHSITECDDFIDRVKADARKISIHALHYRVRSERRPSCDGATPGFQSTHSITECDKGSFLNMVTHTYFNPRTPLQSAIGQTPVKRCTSSAFQSTHSITECDPISNKALGQLADFNPRTPLQSAIPDA